MEESVMEEGSITPTLADTDMATTLADTDVDTVADSSGDESGPGVSSGRDILEFDPKLDDPVHPDFTPRAHGDSHHGRDFQLAQGPWATSRSRSRSRSRSHHREPGPPAH